VPSIFHFFTIPSSLAPFRRKGGEKRGEKGEITKREEIRRGTFSTFN